MARKPRATRTVIEKPVERYKLTPEHRAQLRPWHLSWVKIALRTEPQTDHDRTQMIEAINGLHVSSDLPKPRNIIFTTSPIAAQVAAGLAAGIWYLRENHSDGRPRARKKRGDNPVAPLVSHYSNNYANYPGPLDVATAAYWTFLDAIRDDVEHPDEDFSKVHPEVKKSWARDLAKQLIPTEEDFLCSCIHSAVGMYTGGNLWAAGVDYISFFRHVVKMDIDYSKWKFYEQATIHGSFRYMHPKFCIVVDFPERIAIDEAKRPHSANLPSHRWRDGFEIYHWHGYRVPQEKSWIISHPERITAQNILNEPNAELRRVMCEVSEWKPLLERAELVAEDRDVNGHTRRVLSVRAGEETIRVIEVVNGSAEPDGTYRRFHLGAMPGADDPHQSVAASFGINPNKFKEAVAT